MNGIGLQTPLQKLTNKDGFECWTWQGRHLSGLNQPVLETQKWIDQQSKKIQRADVSVVLGIGSCHHIDQLLQSFPKKKILVPIFEEEIYETVRLRYQGKRTASSNLTVIFSPHIRELKQKMNDTGLLDLSHEILIHKSIHVLSRSLYLELQKMLTLRDPDFFSKAIFESKRLRTLLPLIDLSNLKQNQLVSIKDVDQLIQTKQSQNPIDRQLIKCLCEMVK